VGQHDAVEGNRAKAFGALEVAFLRGRQQRVQHLDRRLEHFHEFQQALVGQAQAARVAVGVGIVLRILFQLADVDLADQAEMSWLFSSPGSVLAMPICLRMDG
jgi:hypothetical protein